MIPLYPMTERGGRRQVEPRTNIFAHHDGIPIYQLQFGRICHRFCWQLLFPEVHSRLSILQVVVLVCCIDWTEKYKPSHATSDDFLCECYPRERAMAVVARLLSSERSAACDAMQCDARRCAQFQCTESREFHTHMTCAARCTSTEFLYFVHTTYMLTDKWKRYRLPNTFLLRASTVVCRIFSRMLWASAYSFFAHRLVLDCVITQRESMCWAIVSDPQSVGP